MKLEKNSVTIGFVSSVHPHSGMHMKTLDLMDSIDEVRLFCIEDQDPVELSKISSKVKVIYKDISELLDDKNIDIIILSARNDLCPEILELSAKAKKHVLFDKPGAVHSKDLHKARDIAEKNNVNLSVMFLNRYRPEIQALKTHVASGIFGKIMSVEARMITSQVRYRDPDYWLFKKRKSGAGILSWLGCHYIDLLSYVLNDRIIEVSAYLDNLNEEDLEVEDTAVLNLKFSKGSLGSFQNGYHIAGSASGYAGASSDNHLAVRGIKGYGTLPFGGPEYIFYSEHESLDLNGIQKMQFTPPDSEAYGGVAGERFLEDFIISSLTGKKFDISIESVIDVLEVIEAAIESSITSKSIRI
ncbi:MAG: Gfo/Idh/MocA family protein [Dehalococcoidia bacterium]